MKSTFLRVSLMTLCLMASITSFAQNRWGIMSGVNLSTSSAKDFGWRTGGYVGGLYDIRLTDSWYIQPQLLFSYEANKREAGALPKFFRSQYALTLPVLASFKVQMSDDFSLRINAGPYVQYAMFGNEQKYGEWWHADFGDHFTYGLKGGLAAEYRRWFFSADCKYSLRKSFLNADGHGLTLLLGLGYKF